MSRRLGDLPYDYPNALVVGTLLVVVAGTLALTTMSRPQEATGKAPQTPYEACLGAARDPGPSGFATEVCEPLSDGFEHPLVSLYPGDFDTDGCVRFTYRHESPEPVLYCPSEVNQ